MTAPGQGFFDRIVDWLAPPPSGRSAAAVLAEMEAAEAAERASVAKAEVVACMSRGLREPLAKVVDCGERLLLEAAEAKDAQSLADLENIQRLGRRLLKLVDEMSDLSAIEAGRMELEPKDVAVGELIAEVVERARPAAEEKGLWLRLELAPDLGIAAWDARRAGQALFEIVDNAVKFTRDGGVTVTARRVGDWADGAVVIDVEDTGAGIDPKRLPRLFDKADAEEPAGAEAGFGLMLSRALCRLMGGEVSARSHPGRGSCFKLRLPTAQVAEFPETVEDVGERGGDAAGARALAAA